MPFEAERTAPILPQVLPRPEIEPAEDVGTLDVAGAAFRADNFIGSSLASIATDRTPLNEADPNYDPFDDIAGYEEHARTFINARDSRDVTRLKAQIDRENEDRRTVAAAGLEGVAWSLAAGIVDPINLIPVGGTAYKTYRAGGSILSAGLVTARSGFVGSTMSEAALQATQETRTWGESAANVAAGVLLSGVLGAGIGAFQGRQLKALERAVERDLTLPPPDQADILAPGSIRITPEELAQQTGEGGSVGAASANLFEEKLKGALGAEKLFSFQDPLFRTVTSRSQETIRTAQKLAETPLVFTKNALGQATDRAVQTKIEMWNAPKVAAIEFEDDAFIRYRLGRERRFGDLTRTGVQDLKGSGPMLSRKEFAEQVTFAMRRSDEHSIPEVAEAAKFYRKTLFDPMKDAAISAKLLADDVTVETAPSYVTRVYNRQRIAQKSNRFLGITVDWLRRSHPELDPLELQSIAEQIKNKILGSDDGRILYDLKISESGPLKERTFLIPDEMIEEFLENDIRVVSQFYTRSMAPDIELAKAFGDIEMTEALAKIVDDYERKIAAADKPSQKDRLQKAKERDLRDLTAMRDRMRGTYGRPKNPDDVGPRVAAAVKKVSYVDLLGGQVFSAIMDPAMIVFRNGTGILFGNVLPALVKNPGVLKMSSREAKLAGAALDNFDTRAQSLADIGDDYGRHTVAERGLDAMTRNFGLVSLMAPWNSFWKRANTTVVNTRLIEASKAWAGGGGSKKEVENLALLGIDQNAAERIAKEAEKHAVIDDTGVIVPNTDLWEDLEAIEAFRSALVKETNRTIITPGQDKPLWFSGTWGSVLFQFKSFMMASTQRILVSGLQQRDMATANGTALLLAGGALAYAIKAPLAGQELSDDPAVWAKEAVDRSGILSFLFEINNISEKLTGGNVGMSALVGGGPGSRFASRSKPEALLGPTFGTVANLSRIAEAATSGEWSESDTRALRRLLPYQNLFYMRGLIDQMEAGVNDALGVKQ